MSSIDNRIVSMQFDNEKFERGVSTTLGSLSKLSDSLKGLDNTSLDDLSNTVENISGRFSNLGIVGMAAIQNITNKVVDLGLEMAKSLSVDQITAGFSKYESSTKDIKALLNQVEGSTIETISSQIESLAWYSDATSYSYSSMVSALKNFASQGISIEEAIPIIMGIGNSMSYAGLAAEEASAGFDIYSKAIAQGYMPLLQWKRLQNMGGATANLKQQFIDAAVALGQLKDNGNGTYSTLKGLEVSISNFDYTLGDADGKWLTGDVIKAVMGLDYGTYVKDLYDFSQEGDNAAMSVNELMDAFEEGNDSIDEFGKKSFQAAQQARTLSEAINAVKDAASTAWMNLFTNLFGNAEEATEMWGNFSDWLYNIFLPPMQRLVDLTSKWKSLGGRDALLEGFRNLADGLSNLSRPISEALGEIFKPFTELNFVNFSNKFRDFTKTFKGLFAKNEAPIGKGLLDMPDDVVTKFDKLKTIAKGLFAAIDILRITISKLVGGFKKIVGASGPLLDWFVDILVKVSDFIIGIRDTITETGGFADGLEKASDALADFLGNFHPIKSIFDFLREAVPFVTGKIKEFVDAVKETLAPAFSLENGNGILGIIGALAGIKALNWNVLDPLKAIFNIPKAIGIVLDDVAGALEVFTVKIEGDALMSVAKGVALLAVSLLLMASIDADKLVGGLAGMGALLLMLQAFLASVTASGSLVAGLEKVGTLAVLGRTFEKIGIGLLVMAVALKLLSTIDFEDAMTSLIAMGGILLEVSLFAKSTKNHVPLIIALAAGILILAGALKLIASIDGNAALGAIGILALLLMEIAAFTYVSEAKALASGAGLTVMSVGILLLVAALAALSALDPQKLIVAIGSLGLALTVLAAAMYAMSSSLGGAAALLVAAVALNALAIPLMLLSTIPFMSLIGGLIAMALAIAILGGAAAILGPMAVSMLAVAGAMALFGLAALALGAGLTMIAASAAAAAASIVGVVTIILTAIPTWATALVNAISTLVVAFAKAISIAIPTLMDTILEVITALLATIDEHLPEIIERGSSILLSLIEGLVVKLPELVAAAVLLVVTFIDNLADALEKNQDKLLTAISKLLMVVLETVANLFKTLMVDVGPKAVEVGINLISGLLEGIGKMAKKLWDKVTEIANGVVNTFKKIFDLNSPSKVTEQMGEYLDEGLVNGLEKFANRVTDAAEDISDDTIATMGDALAGVNDLLESDYVPTITPVLDLTNLQNGSRSLQGLMNNATLPGSIGMTTNLTTALMAEEIAGLRRDMNAMQDTSTVNMATALKEALSTMGVWMDETKVGKLVSIYQANASRMRGV